MPCLGAEFWGDGVWDVSVIGDVSLVCLPLPHFMGDAGETVGLVWTVERAPSRKSGEAGPGGSAAGGSGMWEACLRVP